MSNDCLTKQCDQCGASFSPPKGNRRKITCSYACATRWRNARRIYTRIPDLERFEKKYVPEPNSGCWIWLGGTDRNGYGHFQEYRDGKRRLNLAHRWSYEYFIGPIAEGLQIDHLCRVRACVNYRHLEPVTPALNSRRGKPATATHCRRGHEYTLENTVRYRPNQRTCRECYRMNQRKHYKPRVKRLLD